MNKLGENICSIAKRMVSPNRGVLTGFKDLDSMTLGFKKGEFVIIAGRPSMGKTSLLLQIVSQVVIPPVLVVSAEMSEQLVGERLISQISGVGMHQIKGKRTNLADKNKAKDAVTKIRNSSIYVLDEGYITTAKIRTAINEVKPSAVFIDYLQLLYVPDAYGSGEREVSLISRELKSISIECDVPIVCACQLNRETERRENHAPKMSDLRGSGSIEQDADLILMLHRPAYYRIMDEDPDMADDGEALLYLSKNRNGPVGKLNYRWNKYCMSFQEVSSRYKEFGE